jgi:hypothetical protein
VGLLDERDWVRGSARVAWHGEAKSYLWSFFAAESATAAESTRGYLRVDAGARRVRVIYSTRSSHNTKTNTIMAETYVPLISSGVAGPLGVLHLPRLWLKVSLEARGKLAPGYPAIGKGFDAMTLAALGLDEQAVRDYIKQSKPTYPQFEAWVKENAKSLNRETIENHNAAVRGYLHDDETRKSILSACGIPDDASAPKDAVNLNNLDDWLEFHRAALA